MAARFQWRGVALFACSLVGFVAGPRAWAAELPETVVQAEMLKDLDLLREVNIAREGELLQQLSFWERFRLLERLRFLEDFPPRDPAVREEGR